MSVYDDVDFGLRIQGKKLMNEEKDKQINQALRNADLYKEFGGNLKREAVSPSEVNNWTLHNQATCTQTEEVMVDELKSALDPIVK